MGTDNMAFQTWDFDRQMYKRVGRRMNKKRTPAVMDPRH